MTTRPGSGATAKKARIASGGPAWERPGGAEAHRHGCQNQIQAFCPGSRTALFSTPCSLAQATQEPVKETAPMRAPITASPVVTPSRVLPRANSNGGDRRRRAAAHAVIDGDHLRHVGHLDAPPRNPREAPPPRANAANHQSQVAQSGNEKVPAMARIMP